MGDRQPRCSKCKKITHMHTIIDDKYLCAYCAGILP